MFKRMGRVLTFPVRKAKEKAMQAVVLMVLRNALKLAGLAGVLSDSQLNEAVGAISLLGGLAWSAYNAWREHQAAADAQ